jgi:hypothetical protein
MGLEIIRGSSQVIDMLAAAPFSHGGDRGSKPLGTANDNKPVSQVTLDDQVLK